MNSKELIVIIQQYLNQMYSLDMREDGVFDEHINKYLIHFRTIPKYWPTNRKIVGAVQVISMLSGFNPGKIDGWYGPATDQALLDLKHFLSHSNDNPLWRPGDPGKDAKSSKWPKDTVKELTKFYGDVGTNQVYAYCQYPMFLSWNPKIRITRFSCHKKVKNSIERVLSKTLNHYKIQGVRDLHLDSFGGGLNVRLIRGGDRYSTHSWGCAFDFDTQHNRLRWGKDRAAFASPIYDKWWEFWEDEGAVSLGRAKNYDYMHVQFANVK